MRGVPAPVTDSATTSDPSGDVTTGDVTSYPGSRTLTNTGYQVIENPMYEMTQRTEPFSTMYDVHERQHRLPASAIYATVGRRGRDRSASSRQDSFSTLYGTLPRRREKRVPIAGTPSAKSALPELPHQIQLPSQYGRYASVDRHSVKRWNSAPSGHVTRRPMTSRPQLMHQSSRVDMVSNYMRQATKHYFGLDEPGNPEFEARWLRRRQRLARRAYGRLKEKSVQGESTGDSPSLPPDSLPDPKSSDVTDGARLPTLARAGQKEHVARITWRGLRQLSLLVARGRLRSASQRPQSRSFATASPAAPPSPPTSPHHEGIENAGVTPSAWGHPTTSPAVAESCEVFFDKVPSPLGDLPEQLRNSIGAGPQWSGPDAADSGPRVGHRRIWTRLLDRVFDNSNRRQYGRGFAAKLVGARTWRRSVASREDVVSQLDDLEDHRPYFTYWVTTVQTLIMCISLACYGFGPVGFELQQQSGRVLDTSLSLQQVDYWEPPNLWLGPRAADLIHLGAKFAPCMRRDARIGDEISRERHRERDSACCIRNDNSGCVQTARAACSTTISTWGRLTGVGRGPESRMSGSVCGLDPSFCVDPSSQAPHHWPEDITQWPICKKSSPAPEGSTSAEHMLCEVVGHPCCVGIHGLCRITTREYCNFVRGHFHEEAALCSQVSCLDDVCGMIPFYHRDRPDQFYRLWTSLFLHAGLLHLAITLCIQFFFLRDLEKMAGASRVAVIYIVSGMAGNLASAIFVPYRAEVGPAGSQFGLLACHFVEVINAWPLLVRPWRALLRLVALTMVLFLVGLLPWVDNYAHIFGFVVGFLLSYALLPYLSFGPYDRARKKVLIWVCVSSVSVLVLVLVMLFYLTPFYDCKWCEYLNCLPLTRDFCAEQNINFDRRTDHL